MTRHYAIIERKIAIGIRKPRRESRLGLFGIEFSKEIDRQEFYLVRY